MSALATQVVDDFRSSSDPRDHDTDRSDMDRAMKPRHGPPPADERPDPWDFALDHHGHTPVYQQIAARITEAIRLGHFLPGERLPAERTLAQDLGIARGTVNAAYELLAGQGSVIARKQRGTVIAPSAAHVSGPEPIATPRGDVLVGIESSGVVGPAPLPYQLGIPAMDAFPRKLWTRVTTQVARSLQMAELGYPDPRGTLNLRRTVARYVGTSRGVACTVDQVYITPSHQASLALIAQALFDAGDAVLVEEPCYQALTALLDLQGVRPIPVVVDANGVDIARAPPAAAEAKAAFVCPSNQYPLGVALRPDRRAALLAWAARRDAWIVEDDYDGEYQYDDLPVLALKSIDHADRVIYCGTFSKVLFPGIRTAYVIVPAALTDAFDEVSKVIQSTSATLVQATIARFIADGHFARHLNHMRKLYAARRRTTMDALSLTFGRAIRFNDQAAGMHLVIHLDGRDATLAARCQQAGLAVLPLSHNYAVQPSAEGLLLGFTNIESMDQALAFARRLKDAVTGR